MVIVKAPKCIDSKFLRLNYSIPVGEPVTSLLFLDLSIHTLRT